jgi:hypothetical protein
MYIIRTGGRFGNNIIQLINCIRLALQTKVGRIKYDFDFMSDDHIDLNTEPATTVITGEFKRHEELVALFAEFNRDVYDQCYITTTYIKPLLRFSFESDIDANGLYVHIRSGDLFNDVGWVSPHYTQPPLDYYVQLFAKYKDKHKYVYVEDHKNPVVDRLIELYPDISIKTVDIDELFRVFVNAEYVISGNGTLILSILLFSTRLKRHYTTGAGGWHGGGIPFLKDELKTQRTVLVTFPTYITAWRNTKEQRQRMLTYTGTVLTPDTV